MGEGLDPLNYSLLVIMVLCMICLVLTWLGKRGKADEQIRTVAEVEAREEFVRLLENYLREGWRASGNQWRTENHEDIEKIAEGLIRLVREVYAGRRFAAMDSLE